jgi:hypothetical protein
VQAPCDTRRSRCVRWQAAARELAAVRTCVPARAWRHAVRGPRPVTHDGLQSDTRGSAVDFGAVGSSWTGVDGALVARLTNCYTTQPYTCKFRICFQMNLAFAFTGRCNVMQAKVSVCAEANNDGCCVTCCRLMALRLLDGRSASEGWDSIQCPFAAPACMSVDVSSRCTESRLLRLPLPAGGRQDRGHGQT